jgi:hypothetical protein
MHIGSKKSTKQQNDDKATIYCQIFYQTVLNLHYDKFNKCMTSSITTTHKYVQTMWHR